MKEEPPLRTDREALGAGKCQPEGRTDALRLMAKADEKVPRPAPPPPEAELGLTVGGRVFSSP